MVNTSSRGNLKVAAELFDNFEQLLNYEQLSQWLGLSVSTLQKYVHRREIPVVRFNSRNLKFRVADIRNWLLEKSKGA